MTQTVCACHPLCGSCSGGEPAAKRGAAAAAGGGRFQMGSSQQQPVELTREQQLADIEVCRLRECMQLYNKPVERRG